MADRNLEFLHRTRVRHIGGWLAGLCLAVLTMSAQADDRRPHEVIVTPGVPTAQQTSLLNEDGIVEANSARVEAGVVYLEYRPATGVEREALTADVR